MPGKAQKKQSPSKPRAQAKPFLGTKVTAVLSLASVVVGSCALLLFTAPFLILLFYASPVLDDFCKASLSYSGIVQHDALTIMKLSFTGWSPRWLTILIQSSVMPRIDLTGAYGWLLLIGVLTNFAALWYFFRTFFRLTPARALLIAAGFFAAWLAIINNPAEEFYWLTAAIEYTLPLTELLFLLSLLYRSRHGIVYSAAIAALSFAIPGQHEMAGALLCAFLIIAVAAAHFAKIPARSCYLSLAFAVPSQAIVMFAPGNASRAADGHLPLWDTAHLWQWIAAASHNGLLWLAHPQILLLACCLLLLRQSGPWADVVPASRILAAAAVAGMFAVIGESSLIQIATASPLPDRVTGWLQFWLWLCLICALWAGVPIIRAKKWLPAANLVSWSLFAVSLLGSSQFHSATADLQGPAQAYWRQNKARLAQRGGPLTTPDSPPYPKFAPPQVLSDDPGFWVNQCVAHYLGGVSAVVSNGSLVVSDTGWINHADQGWLYQFYKTADGRLTYWDAGMKGVWWTSSKQYPYLFRLSDSAWLWYRLGSRNPRAFYNLTAKKWESWP